jgi:hypothetical protein
MASLPATGQSLRETRGRGQGHTAGMHWSPALPEHETLGSTLSVAVGPPGLPQPGPAQPGEKGPGLPPELEEEEEGLELQAAWVQLMNQLQLEKKE